MARSGRGLLRGLDGSGEIAPRVLSRELKALTESGLIDRKDYGVVPPKVEYRLTRKGKSFVPVIAAIRDWGHRHLLAGAEIADGSGIIRARVELGSPRPTLVRRSPPSGEGGERSTREARRVRGTLHESHSHRLRGRQPLTPTLSP